MTARQWAARAEPGTPIQWRNLELAAFAEHPKVVRALDPSGKYRFGGPRKIGALRGTGIVIAVIVGIFVVMIPSAIGLAALIPNRPGRASVDPATAVPVAGCIYAYSLLVLIISLVMWLREGRKRTQFGQAQAIAAIITGVLGTPASAIRGSEAHLAHWQLWTMLIGLHTVFAIVLVVLHGAGSTRPDTTPSSAPKPLQAVRRRVKQLSPATREAVRADLSSAIDVLADRDLITAEDADWARDADLGMLALRMAQHPRHHHGTDRDGPPG